MKFVKHSAALLLAGTVYLAVTLVPYMGMGFGGWTNGWTDLAWIGGLVLTMGWASSKLRHRTEAEEYKVGGTD